MPTNNKGLKELWGYPLIDEKARNAISDTRSSLENDFQKKTDDTLGTVDKTVPGAINEIKNNIDTIGDNFTSEQTETKYDMKYNGKSIGSIGIELKENQIAGGDGSFNIDLTPYQTKTDTSLTTTDKTISGAIKELNRQYKDIVNNRCTNSNFLNKIKSNSTLLLTEDIILENGIEFRDVENITVKSETGKTIISCSGNYIFNIINSNNITFENIIFSLNDSTVKYAALVFQQNAYNINIVNCEFETKKSNGISIWCTLESGIIEDVNIKNCSFKTGRMGIECVNHINDDIRRYKNINIINNIYENFGLDSNAMGISLSGYGENCSVKDNLFIHTNPKAIGIELIGCCDSTFDNNSFKGKFVYFSASNDRIMNNLTIINNKMTEQSSDVGSYFKNVINSVLSNNTFGFTRIVSCKSLKMLNNNFYSANGTALIFDNSENCYSSGNLYSTYYATSNTVTLSFYGKNCINNISNNDEFIRSAKKGGVYYNETVGATGNIVSFQKIDELPYPYQSPNMIMVKKDFADKVATFTIEPNFDPVGERIGGLIEYNFIITDGNNNTQSIMVKGCINYHLLPDPIPFLPQVNEIINNSNVKIGVTRNIKQLVITITLTEVGSFTKCTGYLEGKCIGLKKLKSI